MFVEFLNLFYPNLCSLCSSNLTNQEENICFDCLSSINYSNNSKEKDNFIEQSLWGRIKVESAMSYMSFLKSTRSQKLLHKIKYEGHKNMAIEMGKRMGELLSESSRFRNIDLIVPVPLHKKREYKRGYNQAYLLSVGISKILKVKVSKDNLYRKFYTETQTKKTKEERYKNLKGAFEIKDESEFKDKYVLLVDDVFTTGATIESCSEVLLNVDGVQIHLAFLASVKI
jgi:ComF family protein